MKDLIRRASGVATLPLQYWWPLLTLVKFAKLKLGFSQSHSRVAWYNNYLMRLSHSRSKIGCTDVIILLSQGCSDKTTHDIWFQYT